ncbi:ethanolamine ammonia-lyase subunit EutC [Rubrimonas cliftonensis]|uniref:Ethanolamine ammonia-lyase small subunit n=1 Tax=Rubrimonas cliftonensis TaxID=89524 RepID=A0A1H4BY37_9RHOB|nr:ethanolamine ammonia-lyase subunit EutC [Rubrimonas cliftonensis]SEA52990.1 Ethanolamine ammonia-lyase light chain [Rubrimonas cliftonensis]
MSVVVDRWSGLRRHTPARIALGRAGVSLPTSEALAFRAAHAAARTAVHAALDADALGATLGAMFPAVAVLASRAEDRPTYLRRPDLGRRLDDASREGLALAEPKGADVAVAICDGLSALAVERNAARFLAAFAPHVARHGWRLAPLGIALQGRVALGDEIGELLRARLTLMLIGERPGLSSPDSLGVYLTHGPRVGLTDAARNCVSNIRDGGLAHGEAAHRAAYLCAEALRRGLSGVALKDETAPAPAALGGGAAAIGL